jgi:hypothetical protein
MNVFARYLPICCHTWAIGLGGVLLGCGQSQDLGVPAKAVASSCTRDSDCKSGEACNTTSGSCAAKTTAKACTSDADCKSLSTPTCNMTTGQCEAESPTGCTADADCGSPDKPLCNPTTSQCETLSTSILEDCAATEPKCETDYVCVAGPNKCAPDCRVAATPCPPDMGECNQSTGECGDQPSGGGSGACSTGTCETFDWGGVCLEDGGVPAGAPACDVTTGKGCATNLIAVGYQDQSGTEKCACVEECGGDSDAGGGSGGSGPCTTGTCETFAWGNVCLENHGVPAGAPACDVTTGEGCASDLMAVEYEDQSGAVKCACLDQCSGGSDGGTCTTGTCESFGWGSVCLENNDVPAGAPTCDLATGEGCPANLMAIGYQDQPGNERCVCVENCGGGGGGGGECPEPCGASGQACGSGKVCFSDLSCCVPDCRVSGNTCPSGFPTCDQSTGFCAPGQSTGGTCSPACEQGLVCLPNGPSGGPQCVPDCRNAGCPQQVPTCDQSTGLCS